MTAPDEWAGRWLRNALDLAGITQAELLRRLGHRPGSGSYLSQIINGRRQPSVRVVTEAIEACGCEIIDLRVKRPHAEPQLLAGSVNEAKPDTERKTSARGKREAQRSVRNRVRRAQ